MEIVGLVEDVSEPSVIESIGEIARGMSAFLITGGVLAVVIALGWRVWNTLFSNTVKDNERLRSEVVELDSKLDELRTANRELHELNGQQAHKIRELKFKVAHPGDTDSDEGTG